MYKRILVGYDESDAARDALRLATALAHAEGAELLLAACLPYDPLATAADAYDRAVAEAERKLETAAREQLGEIPFSLRTVGGVSPPRALTELAQAEDADVIVIGSTHRGKIGRVLPGSVGERLLHGAPCAVLVAPRHFSDREHFGIGEIGVAFDGRDEARHALEVAAGLAADLDAALRVIAVDEPLDPHEPLAGELPMIREDLEEELRKAGEELGGRGIEARTELLEGPPATVLAERGVELDLLVIGSRGYGPIRHALLGGVSADVMRTSPCPVMVVPRSAP